ncbi:sensor histidine kinase [Spirosoma utsteinense]|uniref:histidine kinase n=1 Tax=Spirosoma utsteinense TaxID=2585773 RepID=A0ABR6W3R8_9BACT|nr:PAS domain-containing sensor histidine kinase [Spirosoma utsteinense]MBC3784750.1 PAS domain S-box-containing protein [Spirosoma utsteinense]MBC3791214.1 PAS domain S-box-containing protein [Spirosoma utsteinense]
MTGKNIASLQDSTAENERLRFALQAAAVGTWDIDIRNGVAWWDQCTKELYGFSGTDTRAFNSIDQLLAYVHPDDRKQVQQAMQGAIERRMDGAYDIEFRINRLDDSHVRWLHAKGQAYFDEQGQAYRFSGIAQDITQQVLARQTTQEAREALQRAIELAELGTWEYDLISGTIEYSPRLRVWHGMGPAEVTTPEKAFRFVREADGALVRKAMIQATTAGSDGHYEVEYRIIDATTGSERILQSLGKAYPDQQGQPYKISGTVQDVTQQRQLQIALEQQVMQRTRQLQASIQDLRRSNENLQQFAYVASHDLQEPLRKIQQFGDLLAMDFADSSGHELDYLSRMQSAASRMSMLIKDLLTFSRLSFNQAPSVAVSLAMAVDDAVENLSVLIGETNAKVQVDDLPVIQGDVTQIGQLFQNLLSNALKFSRTDEAGKKMAPQVHISAKRLAAPDLPAGVKPIRLAEAYCRIDVSDQGIGFEAQHVNRIFQVFQRLHRKDQYAGTGIGLAICQKVVENHGGAITASSKPGEGTTFSVYLPA